MYLCYEYIVGQSCYTSKRITVLRFTKDYREARECMYSNAGYEKVKIPVCFFTATAIAFSYQLVSFLVALTFFETLYE